MCSNLEEQHINEYIIIIILRHVNDARLKWTWKVCCRGNMTLSKFKVNSGRWLKPCNQFDQSFGVFLCVWSKRDVLWKKIKLMVKILFPRGEFSEKHTLDIKPRLFIPAIYVYRQILHLLYNWNVCTSIVRLFIYSTTEMFARLPSDCSFAPQLKCSHFDRERGLPATRLYHKDVMNECDQVSC